NKCNQKRRTSRRARPTPWPRDVLLGRDRRLRLCVYAVLRLWRPCGKTAAAGVSSMPDAGLQFSRVRVAGETQWHVHRAGRFIGSIVERGGEFRATRLVEGKLQSQRFPDRGAAARWLAKLADCRLGFSW